MDNRAIEGAVHIVAQKISERRILRTRPVSSLEPYIGDEIDEAELIIQALSNNGYLRAGPTSSGVDAIAQERKRQAAVEGWTSKHDDSHDWGEMALAAGWYAFSSTSHGKDCCGIGHASNEMAYHFNCEPSAYHWPWDRTWWKPTNPRRDLVKAGALIAAEIDRLDRLPSPPEGTDK